MSRVKETIVIEKSQAQFKLPKPQPKQAEFFKAKNKHIGYGGARGG